MREAADRSDNIVFGTRECNTSMMRAEAVVTQLIDSSKVFQAGFSGWAVRGLESVSILDATAPEAQSDYKKLCFEKHPLLVNKLRDEVGWYAEEVHYHIRCKKILGGGFYDDFTSANTFYPLSRQCPFRFEYELDRIVLQLYLGESETTQDMEIEQVFDQSVETLDPTVAMGVGRLKFGDEEEFEQPLEILIPTMTEEEDNFEDGTELEGNGLDDDEEHEYEKFTSEDLSTILLGL
ncbi:hypothetical protein FRC09_008352 [Ceratobasidium sp. 395]|nr:hypothetical protein FRC09_008352 [Ceratobasidium sp. 395]